MAPEVVIDDISHINMVHFSTPHYRFLSLTISTFTAPHDTCLHIHTILKETVASTPAGMASKHAWQGDQRRPLLPKLEKDFIRNPTATAFQDQHSGQATQGVGELHSLASSQGQICNLSRSPMSSFGSTTNATLPNDFEYDLADHDPGQYANGYQYHHQYHNPHQDPTQDSNPYRNESLNTHQGFVNYHPVDMGGLSEGSSEPSLTSFSYWGNRLGPNQPGATSQDQGAQGRRTEYPTFLDPSPRSYAPAMPQDHEPERYAPGDERPYSSCDEYHLRLGLAVGERFCDIAEGLGRTEESVVGFSEQEGLFWTQEEDDVLRESMMEDYSPNRDAMNHLLENGRRFEEEVFKRAKAVALWDEAAREAAQAENPQSYYPQSPVCKQGGGSSDPQSSAEAGTETRQDVEERRPSWKEREIRILEAWKAQNPNTWIGIDNLLPLLPGRNFNACKHKWSQLHPVGGPRRNDWSFEEFTKLQEWVAGHDRWPNKQQMSKHFPLRDKQGCRNKWRRQGRPWTDEEDNYLNGLQVREDMNWNDVAANTRMQRGRSGEEAKIRHGYLNDCRAQGKISKSLGGAHDVNSSG